MVATEPNNLWMTTILGSYAVGTIGQMANSLIVTSVKEVCGIINRVTTKEERWLNGLPSGDREALVDKIEPSMKRAHAVIGEGAETLVIRKGYTPLVTLDHLTKAYVNADLFGEELTKTVSIGAFNANSGNGRLYLPEVGKTVPFFVEKGLDQGTYAALSHSLDSYVNNVPSMVDIVATEVLANDGRIKRLLIKRAYKRP
ncbi:hypothetical protein X733_24895 [Mesorhizobium sp. L2C067A000]|nr:hypothetical protein X733_24895 [Mesorhizobium sp. L2C067A000]